MVAQGVPLLLSNVTNPETNVEVECGPVSFVPDGLGQRWI
jgi:hypothetical protein